MLPSFQEVKKRKKKEIPHSDLISQGRELSKHRRRRCVHIQKMSSRSAALPERTGKSSSWLDEECLRCVMHAVYTPRSRPRMHIGSFRALTSCALHRASLFRIGPRGPSKSLSIINQSIIRSFVRLGCCELLFLLAVSHKVE